MTQPAKAKDAFSKARSYYEGGLKSGNKKYDDNSAGWSWWKRLSGKAAARNAAQPDAKAAIGQERYEFDHDPALQGCTLIERGGILYETGFAAGNCGELAMVCCYLLAKANIPANQLAYTMVYTPNPAPGAKQADHVFCLFGDNGSLRQLQNPLFSSLQTCSRMPGFADIWALDPWANTCCTLDKYPGLINKKMDSWATYGKRILWIWDPTNPQQNQAWVEPNGEYKRVFAAASLRPVICQ